MSDVTPNDWFIMAIVLLVVAIAAWWLFLATRRTRIERVEAPSEQGSARRNQALIDAPPAGAAVDLPPPTPEGLAGLGPAVAATAEPVHEPAAVRADDLKKIKGVGPRLEALLKSLGITSYAQIAAWDEAEIDRIDAQLGTFQGRIRRDDWPAQARLLAAGDTAGYESRFGKLS